jgi:hypothetical protein
MKTLTTMAAVAALIAGMSLANAQNAGGPAGQSASPSNINKGSDQSSPMGAQSGSESGNAAMKSGGTNDRVVGTGKFCVQVSKSGNGVDCKFASMDACAKEAQPRGLQCSPNPNMGTTGSR